MTDELEIQGLKDRITSEREEKNELKKKLQQLEKECECFFANNFPLFILKMFLLMLQVLTPKLSAVS